MRLTRKSNSEYYVHKLDLNDFKDTAGESVINTLAVINKLGQLEDVEEELGVDFKTFIDAMLHGIYVKVDNKVIDCRNCVGWLWRFSRNENFVGTERPLEYHFDIIDGQCYQIYLKDYKKTWWLTSDEEVQQDENVL